MGPHLMSLLLFVMTWETMGNRIPACPTICHMFTKYTIEDDQTCLTYADLSIIVSLYANSYLKLESKNGNPVSLSTTPCSCPGSFYINDTMPSLYTQKTVFLHPHGQLAAYNCGDFYLYPVSESAQYTNNYITALCLDVALNASGEVTDTSLNLCPEVQPILMESEDGTQLEPVFLCIFPPLSDDVVYDVSWFINDEELTWAASNTVQNADVNSTALRPSNWTGNFSLNFDIACAVRAHNTLTSVSGPWLASSKFFAGIKTNHHTYYVMEGVTSQIALTSTIPFSCPLSLSKEMQEAFCTFYFYIWTPYEGSCRNGMAGNGIALINQPCGVTFRFNDWGNKGVYINVTGYVDGMINYNDRTTFLHIQSTKNPMDQKGIWNNSKIDDIQVKVTDRDRFVTGRQCVSSNDPHMTTFDGFPWENQRTGIFTLYQHKTLPYTVHVIYSECVPRRATCNCGVAVRNGYSFYIVRTCEMISLDNTKMLSVPYEEEYLCDASDLGIVKSWRHYTVTFPTGTQVIFDISSWNSFIGSVRIRASVADIESSVGLCGNSNGDTSDDFIPKDGNTPTYSATFALSWRIPMNSKESLFSSSPLLLQDTSWTYNINAPSDTVTTYCTCAQKGPVDTYQFVLPSTAHCNMTSPSQLCKEDDTVLALTSRLHSKNRRKRFTTDTDDVKMESELTYDPDYNESAIIQIGGWMDMWNETSAREFCLLQFDLDPAVNICNRLVNISQDSFIEDCISDIKLSGNTSFIQDTLDTLKGVCLTEATRNEVFYINQSSETNNLSILEMISSFLCPRNCSGNGACVNATCLCFDGFLGYDCSGKQSIPPHNFLLPSNGLCDKSSRQCGKTNIMGFFHTENVTAKFAYFKVIGPDIQNSAYVKTETANFHHYNLISVQIPEPPDTTRRRRSTGADQTIHGWNISLSYDGNVYSNHVSLLIFDGLVYKCDVEMLTCHSYKTISSSSTTKKETKFVEIAVGAVAGIVAVVIVTIVIVAIGKKCKRKPNSVATTMPTSITGPDRHVRLRKPISTKYQFEDSMFPDIDESSSEPNSIPSGKSVTSELPDIDVFTIQSPQTEFSIPPLKTIL